MFYEALKDVTEYGKQRWTSSPNWHVNNSFEGLVLGGLAGGMPCALPSIPSIAVFLATASAELNFELLKEIFSSGSWVGT
ncbi:mitochondrial substrate carrier family protein E [Sesbania bispinosa]|nr:mitochondrial substrate carrier family protein E [Sesbania bispinosa]